MVIIKKSKSKTKEEYYFVVLAKNKQVLVTSEMYTTKRSCRKSIVSLTTMFMTDSVVEIIDESKIVNKKSK